MKTYNRLLFGCYLIIIIAFLIISLTGCSVKQPEPIVTVKTEVIEKIVIKPCQVPNISCDFTGSDFEPTVKLLDCLILHKRALESCGVNTNIDK